MTDTFARMRQLIGSTAEWAANDLVLGNGEIAIEVVSPSNLRMKFGDGVSRFSALPYSPAGLTVSWDSVTGKPVAFPPSAHTHAPADVTGLLVGGFIDVALIPTAIVQKMTFKGLFAPAALAEYPASPAVGDTWQISAKWTYSTGALLGLTVRPGDWISLDTVSWRLNQSSPLAALDTQGAMLWYDAGVWKVIAPGTAGQVLTSNGPSAAPTWETPA